MKLTLVEIFGCDGEDRVLDIFVLVHFGLVVRLVKVRRVVVLVGDADTNEFRHYSRTNGVLRVGYWQSVSTLDKGTDGNGIKGRRRRTRSISLRDHQRVCRKILAAVFKRRSNERTAERRKKTGRIKERPPCLIFDLKKLADGLDFIHRQGMMD